MSFKEVQVLSLVPDSIKEKGLEENLHIPYLYDHQERLLKSIAIYGKNSHGKSNFIKGFQFFQKFILTSFSTGQIQDKIDVQPFLLNNTMAEKPSYFEISFFVKDTKYRYTCTLTAKEIIEEELHYAQLKVRENYLFKRKGQEIIISKSWNKEADNHITQIISFARPHILLLSVLLSQEKIPRIQSIFNWLNSNLIIPDDYLKELTNARSIYSDPLYKKLILKFIKNADLGFKTIFDKVEDFSKPHLRLEKGLLNMWFDKEIRDFELYTNHEVYNNEGVIINSIDFELQKNESAGSIKYFILISLISYAIKNSSLIWIDELDARFHSSLLEMLIKSFHNPAINPINSQMIFTTHNTILLDKKLRRDHMVVV
ncbi:MAG: ATP-binding protein, partial [Ferruginibacter sp.]